MHIIVPFNTNYLKTEYNMTSKMIDVLSAQLLPMLLTRLSRDGKVCEVILMTNLDAQIFAGISAKIKILPMNTEKLKSAEEVISAYFTSASESSEVNVFYNPLFPFVSIKTIYAAYVSVVDDCFDTAFGGFSHASGNFDMSVLPILDQGSFRVIRKTPFMQCKKIPNNNLRIIQLSARELLCLRTEQDIDLYDLIINAGAA